MADAGTIAIEREVVHVLTRGLEEIRDHTFDAMDPLTTERRLQRMADETLRRS